MKKFMDLVQKRYSVRRYLDRPVEQEKIIKCIEAARLAPSAENVQPWSYLVIDEPALLARLKKAAFSGIYRFTRWADTAPVIIAALARPDFVANKIGAQIQDINFYYIDMGIATEHLILQAAELGLGTCWIGWFNVKEVRNILSVPDKYKIVSLITLGYYNHKLNKKKRKSLEKILFFNTLK